MLHPLPRRFFERSPELVAPDLLGKLLVRRGAGKHWRARIVETEAYLGAGDAAAHSAAGLTRRNAVLFGPPGYAYIYLIYGLHLCLNVSTLPEGAAGGVLFRALEAVEGCLPPMNGPGLLSRALGLRLTENGCDLTRAGSLYLADDGYRRGAVAVTARVGIRKAAELPYRFYLQASEAVSRPRGPVLAQIPALANSSQGLDR